MSAGPGRSTNATTATVASSATSVTIFAANGYARKRMVYNDSTQTLYLKFSSAAASVTDFTVPVATNQFYEFPGQPCYLGTVTGIWTTANGNARTTEY